MDEKSIIEWIQMLRLKSGITVLSDGNVFSVLNIESKEVTWCKILKFLIEREWVSFENIVLRSACGHEALEQIATEYPCVTSCNGIERDGRIDIYLETRNHAVAIEVKLFAKDQPQQLCRYHKFLSEAKKGKNPHIFYLTIDKKEASVESLSCAKGVVDCISETVDYEKIGFCDEIYRWLEYCLKQPQTESSTTIYIEHFIEMLNCLKGQREMEANAKIISDNINDKNCEDILAFFAAQSAVWEHIRSEFFNEICRVWQTEGCGEYIEDYCQGKNEVPNECVVKKLMRNQKAVYLCYKENFYLRTAFDEQSWKPIKYNNELISMKKMPTSANHPVIQWFVNGDDGIIDNVIRQLLVE